MEPKWNILTVKMCLRAYFKNNLNVLLNGQLVNFLQLISTVLSSLSLYI